MRISNRSGIGTLLLAVLPILAACAGTVSDSHVIDDPAELQEVEGSAIPRISLTEQAAVRLGITTASVDDGGGGMVVPSAALFVDPTGTFWVYTNPEPLVYVRHETEVIRFDGDVAYLAAGPAPGTAVVTVGVPELYGFEYGIGK